MPFRRISRSYCHATVLLLMLAGGSGAAYARDSAPAPAGLRSLAQEFVQKMKQGFQEADDYYRTYYAGDMREQESFVDIPDGEVLLLQIILPKRLRLPDPVMAIKQGRDVMISLSDFSNIARFKIDVFPEERRADGWFIRQEKNFNLDLAAGTAQVAGQTYALQAGDVLEQDNTIFVRADALSSWMGFDMEVNIQRQNIDVATTEKWPVQEAMDRKNRGENPRQKPPSMPRQEDPYSIIGPANIDLNIRQQYRKPAEDKAINSTNYSLRSDGDLAAHTASAVLAGTREDKLSSARLTFSRDSDQPDLLGPLGARKYEFGDIAPSRVRLGGPVKGGLGARATNRSQTTTTDASTRVEVEGTPGWDVEIFRGSQLLGTGTVDETGRFAFEDVLLVPGENLFRIVQYGPFGEITEDKQSFYAGLDRLNKDGFSYDVSLTAANTRFYDANESETPDQGEPHLAMEFEKQLLENMAGRVGSVSSTTDNTRKQYFTTGLTAGVAEALIGLDAAYDIDGAYQSAATARRQFGSLSAGVSAGYTSAGFADGDEEYGDDDDDEDEDIISPGSFNFSANTRVPLGRLFDKPVIYNTDHEYSLIEGGGTKLENEMGLSGYISRLNVSQSLRRTLEEDNLGEETKEIEGATNVTGRLMGARWRLGANYEFTPETQFDRYALDITKPISPEYRTNLKLEHEPIESLSKGTASVTYMGEHASLTPSLTYDSEGNMSGFLNLGVGMAYDPLSSSVVFSGRPVGGLGGVSALVYLDKDGSFSYNEGDELLPDVTIEAVHANRRAETDENGVAFLYNLAAGQLTDVLVQDNSLPDALYVAGREGVAVLPRPGNTTELDFPIHMAGEIDGTVYKASLEGGKTLLPGVTLKLHRASDGHLEASAMTAPDGFYIFDRVRPGEYLLLVAPEDARRRGVTATPPQRIHIGYEGTTLYANNITLREGPPAGIGFADNMEEYARNNPQIDIGKMLEESGILFHLGEYNSNLTMSLAWLRAKQVSPRLREFGKPVVPPGETSVLSSDQTYILRVLSHGITLDQAQSVCLELGTHSLPCTVEILTKPTNLAQKE